MQTITVNDKKYYLANEIIKNAPIWSSNIRRGRDLIKQKNITTKNYMYARLKDDEWIENTDYVNLSKRLDKVLIKVSYMKTIQKFMDEINDKFVENNDSVMKAPNIIDLDDSEKFKDDKGNILNIETRGEKQYTKLYFKVKDISNCFGIKNLSKLLLNDKGNYVHERDYVYFDCTINKINNKTKNLFLTYLGLLRVLFVSRCGHANKFIDWAANKLFTLQMGTSEQKKFLAGDILGVDARLLTELFDKQPNTLSCIYFATFGRVKDLRKIMNILDKDKYKDDDIVGKFGFSNNGARRAGEHLLNFGKIKGIDLKIKYCSYIDPQYISAAEADVRSFMKSISAAFVYKKEEEVVILTQEQLISTKAVYGEAKLKYAGHVAELHSQIKDLRSGTELMKKDMEQMKQRCEKDTKQMKRLCEKDMEQMEQMKQQCEKDMKQMKKGVEQTKQQCEKDIEQMKDDVEQTTKQCEKDLKTKDLQHQQEIMLIESKFEIQKLQYENQKLQYENQLLKKDMELMKIQKNNK